MNDITTFLRKLFPNPLLVDELERVSKLMEIPENITILNISNYVKIVPLVIEGRIKVMRNYESGKEVLLYYIRDCIIRAREGRFNKAKCWTDAH